MNSERRWVFLAVAVVLVGALLGAIYGPPAGAAASSADDYQTAVKQFTRVLDVVQSNYADPVDVDKEVYQGAIPGMLRVLDPHSNFFDARQFALLPQYIALVFAQTGGTNTTQVLDITWTPQIEYRVIANNEGAGNRQQFTCNAPE